MENEYQKSASKKFPDKKFIIAICTTVLLVITILVTLVQLFDQNSNDVHIPQLHFIVNDEIYATIETNGNEVIKLPNNPAKDGYKFDGWYWYNNLWNRPFTANSLLDEPLSSDMSVYAKFTNINIEPPTQESIINELNKIPNVVAIEAATEYNDPNGQLNKDGGYIAHIYFSVDVIKQDDVYGITLVEKGTEAGGSIEIYRNQQDAEKRNTYLTTLDGTILSSGSHKVVGTCVVRTSDILTASLQNILENNLEKMLTGKTDYVNMDTYLIQIAKTIAQNENLSEFETVSKLIGYGYPQKKSEDIAKSCGVNFNETAKYLIEGYADYYATVSPAMVSTLLSERGFSDDNISYAIEKSNVDWKWYAQIHAREFIVMYSETRVISPLDVINYLQAEKGYTKADSEYGITNDEISWDILAVNYINDFLLHNNLKTKRDYIEALANVNFTEQQIKYALDNCNIDWNTLALNNLSYYVENLCNTTPNYTQCLSKLKEWGFNDKEASYALQNHDINSSIGLSFELNEDANTYRVSSLGSCTDRDVVIPSIYQGIPVTIIGEKTVYNCANIQSITIPSSITEIRSWAFYGCTSLKAVYIDDITAWCSIFFQSNPLEQAKKLYLKGVPVKELVIPEGPTKISSSAFINCETLVSIEIPNTVTEIGQRTFNGCTNLKTIKIGRGVTEIWDSDCPSLEKIYVNDIEQWLKINFMNINLLKYANALIVDGNIVTDIIVPQSITKINDNAFYGYKALNSIELHNGITAIGYAAFSNCSSLRSIVIPDSVKKIGKCAFRDCYSLSNIIINGDVTSIADDTFNSCTSLISITIPNSVTSIGNSAFNGCSSLINITIPDNVNSIGSYAFNGCSSLVSVTIPNGVTSIKDYTFNKCISLTSITIPNSIRNIGYCSFNDCNSISDIYYTGSANEWWNISNIYNHTHLRYATKHFNYVPEE